MNARNKTIAIRASLSISGSDLEDDLNEALSVRGEFTHVVHRPPGAPAGPWVGLLRLNSDYSREPADTIPITQVCLIEKQGRVAAPGILKVIDGIFSTH